MPRKQATRPTAKQLPPAKVWDALVREGIEVTSDVSKDQFQRKLSKYLRSEEAIPAEPKALSSIVAKYAAQILLNVFRGGGNLDHALNKLISDLHNEYPALKEIANRKQTEEHSLYRPGKPSRRRPHIPTRKLRLNPQQPTVATQVEKTINRLETTVGELKNEQSNLKAESEAKSDMISDLLERDQKRSLQLKKLEEQHLLLTQEIIEQKQINYDIRNFYSQKNKLEVSFSSPVRNSVSKENLMNSVTKNQYRLSLFSTLFVYACATGIIWANWSNMSHFISYALSGTSWLMVIGLTQYIFSWIDGDKGRLPYWARTIAHVTTAITISMGISTILVGGTIAWIGILFIATSMFISYQFFNNLQTSNSLQSA